MSWLSPPAEGQALVAPSLLAADFSILDREIARMTIAGADCMHLDIMDGHFVPNLTFGPCVVTAVRRVTDLPLDAHLMLTRPDRFIEPFVQAGADSLTIHVESEVDIPATLNRIADLGAKRGITLNPPTPLAAVKPFLEQVDMVLVMTVMPGFGGQVFNPVGLDKIKELTQIRAGGGGDYLIAVDGGIDPQTGALCRQAGADILVSGSWLFHAADARAAITDLRCPAP